jgi:GxxExxY protein
MIVPVHFKGLNIETELRCDLFIENCLVVEIKSVSELAPIHKAQLLTYMKLLKAPKGILFNFNCVNLYRDGQKTFVNEFFRDLPEL